MYAGHRNAEDVPAGGNTSGTNEATDWTDDLVLAMLLMQKYVLMRVQTASWPETVPGTAGRT